MVSNAFTLVTPTITPATGTVELHYRGSDGTAFTETLQFAPFDGVSDAQMTCLQRAVRLTHLVAGVSYYKLDFGKLFDHAIYDLTATESALLNAVYTIGLSEFILVNGLNHTDAPQFTATAKGFAPVDLHDQINGYLVPIGGGKDSVVTLEAMKKLGGVIGFHVGHHAVVDEMAETAGVSSVSVTRKISKTLFAKNEAGGLNGHIPVTAINSCISIIQAIIGQNVGVAFSNERSANVGNTIATDDFTVNHQWSKSIEFETLFRDVVHGSITPSISYFSALRALSEIAIAKAFAGLDQYHPVFTSCNRAFKIRGRDHVKWCGECEKCRFVFLIFACFLPVDYLEQTLGFNALADMDAMPDYLGMVGAPGTRKPLECVGEVEEVHYAFQKLLSDEKTAQLAVVAEIGKRMDGAFPATMETAAKDMFTPRGTHFVPDEVSEILEKMING